MRSVLINECFSYIGYQSFNVSFCLFQRLLAFDQKRRISAREALKHIYFSENIDKKQPQTSASAPPQTASSVPQPISTPSSSPPPSNNKDRKERIGEEKEKEVTKENVKKDEDAEEEDGDESDTYENYDYDDYDDDDYEDYSEFEDDEDDEDADSQPEQLPKVQDVKSLTLKDDTDSKDFAMVEVKEDASVQSQASVEHTIDAEQGTRNVLSSRQNNRLITEFTVTNTNDNNNRKQVLSANESGGGGGGGGFLQDMLERSLLASEDDSVLSPDPHQKDCRSRKRTESDGPNKKKHCSS